MILPHNNKQLARKYFETLPSGDVNHKYYEGEKYKPPTSCLGVWFNYFKIYDKLDTLQKFYPYQKVIRQTSRELKYDQDRFWKNGLIFTGVAWTLIFNLGRRGYVLPLLKQYGSYFNTHRIFRQYLYCLIVPPIFSEWYTRSKYHTHIETLWKVHANRLNQKNLDDPLYTYYPESLLSKRRTVNIDPSYNDKGKKGYQFEKQKLKREYNEEEWEADMEQFNEEYENVDEEDWPKVLEMTRNFLNKYIERYY